MRYRDKFKEIDYSNYLIETSDVKRNNLTYELGLIYRKLRIENYDEDKVIDILENVIINYKPDATDRFVQETIKRVVKYNQDRKLYQLDKIEITNKEIEYIKNQPI